MAAAEAAGFNKADDTLGEVYDTIRGYDFQLIIAYVLTSILKDLALFLFKIDIFFQNFTQVRHGAAAHQRCCANRHLPENLRGHEARFHAWSLAWLPTRSFEEQR